MINTINSKRFVFTITLFISFQINIITTVFQFELSIVHSRYTIAFGINSCLVVYE